MFRQKIAEFFLIVAASRGDVRDEGREELPEAVELQDEPEEGEAVQNEGDPREIRRRADGLVGCK